MKIFKRGETWAFKKTHEGKPVWVSLRTKNKQDAETKKAQFQVTLKNNGWEAAKAELRGKRILKKGESPTIEDMERIYREFIGQSVKKVAESTIRHNIGCLRRLLTACKARDIGSFDPSKLKWTEANTSNQSSQVRAAQSMFKKSALIYWAAQGIHLKNPFGSIEKHTVKQGGYIPLGQECRERIWNESKNLLPRQRMIVILALGAGLRRGEIQAARVSWLVNDRDKSTLTVQSGYGFKPKSGIHRSILISKERAAELLELRKTCLANPSDPFLIPDGPKSKKVKSQMANTRLGCQFKILLPWLFERGVKEVKGIHGLRREAGSVVASNYSMLHAQKFLGHASIVTTEKYYAGLTKSHTIDMETLIFAQESDPFAPLAKKLGISVEELKVLVANKAAVTDGNVAVSEKI